MATYDLTRNFKTLVNLIPNPSFESSTSWSGVTYSSDYALFGIRSSKLSTDTTIVNSITTTAQPILNHKYYGRHYIKTLGNSTPDDCRFEWYAGDGVGLNWVFGYNRGDHSTWHMESAINTIDAINGSNYKIRNSVINGTFTCYCDGLMLVDLTKAFGSGNEPTKEWCDNNIPFFIGSLYLTYLTTKIATNDILNCPCSKKGISIVLPKGIYKLEVWGAESGKYDTSSTSGKGGYSTGVITLALESTFHLYAGGQGTAANTSGGFNGGGSTKDFGGSGGGASDIRIDSTSLYARVIVAGGGGGPGYSTAIGGYAGGLTGGQGGNRSTTGGYGGTQTAPGSNNTAGSFGKANSNTSNGGGGGGGWYGGASGCSSDTDSGGGGGSGYIYNSSSAGNYPSGCLLNSSHYLSTTTLSNGNTSFLSPTGTSEIGHTGNGYVRITVLDIKNLSIKVNIDGVWKDSSSCYIKVDGVWKTVTSIYDKISDTWHTG